MPSLPTLPPPVMTELVTIDGVALHTVVVEPVGASRGDVVFCHGTPWSSAVWHRAVDAVRDSHRVHL